MAYRIGIDVGGRGDDVVLAREDGGIRLLKTPTTLEDQSVGVMNGASILRVHDVQAVKRAIEVVDAARETEQS